MSLKLDLEKRIKDVEEAVQQSIWNHNRLIGILEEAKRIYADVQDVKQAIEEVTAPVSPTE